MTLKEFKALHSLKYRFLRELHAEPSAEVERILRLNVAEIAKQMRDDPNYYDYMDIIYEDSGI